MNKNLVVSLDDIKTFPRGDKFISSIVSCYFVIQKRELAGEICGIVRVDINYFLESTDFSVILAVHGWPNPSIALSVLLTDRPTSL